ncbi:MAG TPA: trehalose-phosphatase, partial [Thermoanaerobaculia bacterium]|nr:trehalose-phosphatase [Thermoanaerobaculia bacterium]
MKLLLATDFDGTIAAIEQDPGAVKLDDSAERLFLRFAGHPDLTIALISGRDLSDLEPRTRAVRAWRSGSHGLEIQAPDGTMIREHEPWSGSLNPIWERAAEELSVRLERKKFGIAVHWRGVPGVDGGHPLIHAFRQWARQHKMNVTEGRSVVEARLPGPSKRDVLQDLTELTCAERVIYAGDDLTDFPALEWASTRGRAFLLQSE